jgi:hypothetical protein
MFPFVVAALIIAAGCDESPTTANIVYSPGFLSERSQFVLDGTVVDANNNPFAGADIHFLYTVRPVSGVNKKAPLKAMPTTTIGFGIPKETHITLRVYRLGTRELIATLIDSVMRAGIYHVSTNVEAMTNGIYVYQISGNGIFFEHLLWLLNEDLSVLTKAVPLVRTDSHGKFRIPYGVFGLEETFVISNDSDLVLETVKIDSIGIVVCHSGNTMVRWMKIPTHTNMHETFTLQ